jgi:hypothetical protein
VFATLLPFKANNPLQISEKPWKNIYNVTYKDIVLNECINVHFRWFLADFNSFLSSFKFLDPLACVLQM